jgi:hypothetical protein
LNVKAGLIKPVLQGCYKTDYGILYREKAAKADIKRTALTVLAGAVFI